MQCELCGKGWFSTVESTHCLDCACALEYLKKHDVQCEASELLQVRDDMTEECGRKVHMGVAAVVLRMVQQ
jgi:glutaredoxin-related protein